MRESMFTPRMITLSQTVMSVVTVESGERASEMRFKRSTHSCCIEQAHVAETAAEFSQASHATF